MRKNILNISEAASIAIHAAVVMSRQPEKLRSARELAEALNVSLAHLAKVMQRLAKAGIVRSERGPAGGFALDKLPEAVSLMDIYEAVEGAFEEKECLLTTPICGGACVLGGLIGKINQEVKEAFTSISLGSLKPAKER